MLLESRKLDVSVVLLKVVIRSNRGFIEAKQVYLRYLEKRTNTKDLQITVVPSLFVQVMISGYINA